MIQIQQGNKTLNFVHIPKTGGSTVTRYLFSQFDYKMLHVVNGQKHSHMHPRWLNLDGESFTVVRHPVTWIESVWKHLRASDTDHVGLRSTGYNPVTQCSLLYKSNFTLFIDNILNHWPDIYHETIVTYTNADMKIIHTETLNTDLKEVLEDLGFDFRMSPLDMPRIGTRRVDLEWDDGQMEEFMEANKTLADNELFKHYFEKNL